MRRALALAKRGVGHTSPNPVVGAVVVRAGKVIGEGWHRVAGAAHAEIEAMRAAGRRNLAGATLYVTLEPCSTHGRTPPCTNAIVAAGIRRVVVAATDPNPNHAGRGLKILRRAGVQVDSGLLAHESAAMNVVFNKWITTGMPWLVAKCAMSLDGKIATRCGDSQWITSVAARREGHKVRARVDAVMVAAGTVRRDDPSLTLRHGVRGRQPWRVVVDGRGRCSKTAKLFTDRWRNRTIAVTTKRSSLSWRRDLALQGVTVLVVEADAGHVRLPAMMRALGDMEITSVLMEGGGDFLGALLEEGLVDRVMMFYAPLVIGGREASSAVMGQGAGTLAEAWRFTRDARWRRVDEWTMLFEGSLER